MSGETHQQMPRAPICSKSWHLTLACGNAAERLAELTTAKVVLPRVQWPSKILLKSDAQEPMTASVRIGR